MNIVLHGLVSRTLGGYVCLRGYASINDLLNISEVTKYQRDIDRDHIKNIEQFYEKGRYLFFPEIILGCNLPNYSVLKNVRDNESFTYTGIKYKFLKTEQQGYLTIDTDIIKLHRIDGNHRLSAFKKGTVLYDEIPFCVLFLAEEQTEKHAKIIFNNINYKNKLLRQEDNLKNIYDEKSKYHFTDTEIKKEFGINYDITKFIIKKLEKEHLQHIYKNRIDKYYREGCFKVINTLNSFLEKENLDQEKIYNAIKETLEDQKEKIDVGLFIAYVYYKYLDNENPKNKKYHIFTNWIKKNNIINIKNICSEDVIKIFNNIWTRKKRQIFVSMPFGPRNCENMFNEIKNVVRKLSDEYKIEMPLVLRIDELQSSSTYPIVQKIEDAIENTGYFIAILNYNNPNVYHEIGYAMGYINAKGKNLEDSVLLVLEEPEEQSQLKNDNQYNVGFNLQGYHQLRFKTMKEFGEKLEEKLISHYNLKLN